MVREDGTRITVQVDSDFAVTNVQEGGPGGRGAAAWGARAAPNRRPL